MRPKPQAVPGPEQPGTPYSGCRPGTNATGQGFGEDLIKGVQLRRQQVHVDPRGELVALEQFASLPFTPKRVFFMKVDSPTIVRVGHANSCDELIVAVSGSVLVEVDNGHERASARLSGCDQALWISSGILIRLREFGPGTVLLVCASAPYGETRHFERPQPGLVKAGRPA